MEPLSEREKDEIARLAAAGLRSRLIGAQIGRHHRTVWGHIVRLRLPVPREPVRSALRLSLAEREEISRGVGRWRVVACDRATVGPVAVFDLARGRYEWWTPAISGVSGRRGCCAACSSTEAVEARVV
jgi:hypothetical protein